MEAPRTNLGDEPHDHAGIATILVSAPSVPSAIYGAMREVLARGYRIRTQYDRKDAQGNTIDPPSLDVASALEILDPYAQPRFPKSSCVEIGKYIAETCWGVKDHRILDQDELKTQLAAGTLDETKHTYWPYTYHQRLFAYPASHGRTVNQVQQMLARLAEDPLTRRATAITFVPEIDHYIKGDLPWRASLRLGRLYVTQYHQERNADVVLMLDTLGHVGVPPATSLDLCVRAAASLAWGYLTRKDRVGLIEYGGVVHWVRPGSGRIQLDRLLDGLVAAQIVFTYVAKDLSMVPPRVLPPQALVIALSPLLDARFIKAVGDLVARGFQVVLLSISPIDLTRGCLVPSPLSDLACRLWTLERQAQVADLRRQGLAVIEWRPDQPLELVLAPFARHYWQRALAG